MKKYATINKKIKPKIFIERTLTGTEINWNFLVNLHAMFFIFLLLIRFSWFLTVSQIAYLNFSKCTFCVLFHTLVIINLKNLGGNKNIPYQFLWHGWKYIKSTNRVAADIAMTGPVNGGFNIYIEIVWRLHDL